MKKFIYPILLLFLLKINAYETENGHYVQTSGDVVLKVFIPEEEYFSEKKMMEYQEQIKFLKKSLNEHAELSSRKKEVLEGYLDDIKWGLQRLKRSMKKTELGRSYFRKNLKEVKKALDAVNFAVEVSKKEPYNTMTFLNFRDRLHHLFNKVKSSEAAFRKSEEKDRAEEDFSSLHLEEGSFIRPLDCVNANESCEVIVVGSGNNPLYQDVEKFTINPRALYRNASIQIKKSINLLPLSEKKEDPSKKRLIPPGNNFVVLQDSDSWYYIVKRLDENYNPIDELGRPSEKTFKVSKIHFDNSLEETLVANSIAYLSKKDFIEKQNCKTSDKKMDPVKVEKKVCSILDENLLGNNFTYYQSSLFLCLQDIKDRIVKKSLDENKSLDREKFLKALYSLSPKERDFIALTFTAQGESGIITPPLGEMMIIMKALENRRNNANNKIAKKNEKANIELLDVALQPFQFSMYNEKDSGWKTVLLSGKSNIKNEKNAIDAFLKMKDPNTKILPSNITHYVANYLYNKSKKKGEKRWYLKEKKTKVKVFIDNDKKGTDLKGKNGVEHFFYSDMNWPLPTHQGVLGT